MKKAFNLVFKLSLVLCMSFSLFGALVGCQNQAMADGDYIDLTTLGSTMVYSQVFDMVSNPANYTGKTVKANGRCGIYYDDSTGTSYYAVVIQDATACCAQGIEFVLTSGNYPNEGNPIVVEGIFGTYVEGGVTYCVLNSATLL